jgi:hypothetical protein
MKMSRGYIPPGHCELPDSGSSELALDYINIMTIFVKIKRFFGDGYFYLTFYLRVFVAIMAQPLMIFIAAFHEQPGRQ